MFCVEETVIRELLFSPASGRALSHCLWEPESDASADWLEAAARRRLRVV